jgi:hypothetical protein
VRAYCAILGAKRTPDYLPAMLAGQDWSVFAGVVETAARDTTAAVWQALQWWAEQKTEAPLVILENDLCMARNATLALARSDAPEGYALLTWFRHLPIPDELAANAPERPFLYRVPFLQATGKGRFSNTQAVTLPARTCRHLLASEHAFRNWFRRPFADLLIGRLLTGHYGVVMPSIVEHAGARSSYGWDSSKILAVETIAPDGDALAVATALGLVSDG